MKQQQEQLWLDDVIGGLPLPVLVLSPAGVATHENPAYRARFGPRTDERGEIASALRGGHASALCAALDGVSRAVPLGSISGAPFTGHYFPIRDASSAVAFVGILFVEERAAPVPAAPALTSETHDIPEVERSLRRILDMMPQLVWSTRPDGYHDFYNRRWYDYTGETPDATRGAGWNDQLHPDDQQRAWERWVRSVETGEDYQIEYRFRRADGAYRWFLGRALPMRDEAGRILRWFGTCTDVDDQKRLEQQRAEVLAQAEETSRLKDEFLAIVSHELRTPLTAILGWARMQRSRPELAPKAMEVIERNAEAQARLIEEILESSRIVTGKIRLYPRNASVNELVRTAVDAIRPAADAKAIALDVRLDPGVGEIVCDPDRLQQVVTNLLVNAVKFTPGGGQVGLQTALHPGGVEVTVTDTGKGISAAFLPHVFERFRQAEAATTRQHGGLGLGLAIVKYLVELHGGAVRARSDGEGKGASFCVRLPVRAVALAQGESSEVSSEIEHPSAGTIPRLDGLRVLVVDDEPDARELVTMVLREAGAQADETGSASAALEMMSRARPDVLVSDIAMPEQDGYALLRELRSRAPDLGGSVPALALTAFARREDIVQARDAGFQLHLAKPVQPGELVAAVYRLARKGA
ncbi:hybrid sensor histidine kinase/response regulator [Sorangium sp. KYC3313]|uniref:hybrid sensor histidine kinase/response regulator n=1 Tax=Sorangium sp. KYC3313 TaxID=3449740 RepID=UPI003F8A81CC